MPGGGAVWQGGAYVLPDLGECRSHLGEPLRIGDLVSHGLCGAKVPGRVASAAQPVGRAAEADHGLHRVVGMAGLLVGQRGGLVVLGRLLPVLLVRGQFAWASGPYSVPIIRPRSTISA